MRCVHFDNIHGNEAKDLKNPYVPIVLHLVPRILTNLDRDEDSPTYGCFDRNFWHYKVHDYSSTVLQQCSLTLALVYKYWFEGNIYYNSEMIKGYAIAGVKFCEKIQHKNGSFDEYWVGEHSIPATAFALYGICETCDHLGIQPDISCIDKAVDFLVKHMETAVLNQEMASVAAIRYAGEILEVDEYKEMAKQKFANLLSQQKNEGWFSEYEGLDLSYLTVNLDYLIRYYELSKDPDALISAKKILDLIKYFIHPDGSFGGEYGTRNTEYFAPYGIEFLKKYCPVSNEIVRKLLGYIHQDSYLNLNCDERYYLHYLSHSFMKGLLIYSYNPWDGKLPCETTFEKYFDESKIFIKSTNDYYFIANLSKGGVFKVFDKRGSTMSTDCGFRFLFNDNLYVTEMPRDNNCSIKPGLVEVTAPFTKMNFIQQSFSKLLILRIISRMFGFGAVRLTKKLMILGSKGTGDMFVNRKIFFGENEMRVVDSISVGDRHGLLKLSNGLSVRHTASSRFFQSNTLNNLVKPATFEIKGNFTASRIIEFGDAKGLLDETNKSNTSIL